MGFYEDDRIRSKNALWDKLVNAEKAQLSDNIGYNKVKDLETPDDKNTNIDSDSTSDVCLLFSRPTPKT